MNPGPYDPCNPDPSFSIIDGWTNDDPHLHRWRLKNENESAARRALYAAKAQLV